MSFKQHIEEEYGVLTEARIPNARPDINLQGIPIRGVFYPAGTMSSYGIPYYGETATKEKQAFKSIVVHHTAGTTVSGAIDAAFNPRYGKDGSPFFAGYHLIIDRNGDVYQTAPESVRTNHSTHYGQSSGLFNNRRCIGVSCVGGANGPHVPQGKQRDSALKVIAGLMAKYRISDKAIAPHIETDSKSNDEGKWIKDAIKSGELAEYRGVTKVSPVMFADVVSDVTSNLQGTSGALTGLAIAGILMGGAYAFKSFLGRKDERLEAERIMDDRETKLMLMRIRMEHEDLIERAKSDPRAADLLKRVMNDAVSGRARRSFYQD